MRWIRSSRCESGNCVEVARDGSTVLVRDSKNPDAPALPFSERQWMGFLSNVRSGHLPWTVNRQGDGKVVISAPSDPHGNRLRFYDSEWSAFVEGAKAGNFDLGLVTT